MTTTEHDTDDETEVEPLGNETTDGSETTDGNETTDDSESPTAKKSAATRLVELAADLYELGVDTEGRPFAIETNGPNLALPFRGGRLGLRAQLAAAYHQAEGKVAPSSALADALLALEGQAAQREPTACGLRVAPNDAGIVVDLGTPDGDAVTITPSGWSHRTESPMAFHRTALTGAMPHPIAGGSLHELRSLVNVTDDSWPLLLGWIVAGFLPSIPHPVLSLSGEMGTGKTTAARTIVSILDPSPGAVRTAPRDVESWAIQAAGSWVVAIDNVSGIAPWLSDALCRAVTGDALVRRQLYTDGDLVVLNFRRCVILTAIDAGALRGDLADRLVRVELEPIPPHKRRTDGELAEALADAGPRVLGAIFDLVADVLRVYPDVKLDTLPRMADYARVLAAIVRVSGTDCLARYLSLGSALMADVVDDDPVAAKVRDLCLANHGSWAGTASDLYDRITPERTPKGWPANPRTLSAQVKNATTALRSVGIEVSRGTGRGQRTFYLEATDKARNPASPASPASRTAGDLPGPGDATGDAEPHGDAHAQPGDAADPALRHHETPGRGPYPATGDAGDAGMRDIFDDLEGDDPFGFTVDPDEEVA